MTNYFDMARFNSSVREQNEIDHFIDCVTFLKEEAKKMQWLDVCMLLGCTILELQDIAKSKAITQSSELCTLTS